MRGIKKSLKSIIEKLLKINKRFKVSFSKSGDDILLNKLINETTPGVYLDVGSWEPKQYSNTYFFYEDRPLYTEQKIHPNIPEIRLTFYLK